MNEPSDIVAPGVVPINGTVTEYASGSGIDRITIILGDETIFDETYDGESFIWIDWQFTAYLGEIYNLHVKAWDKAGLPNEARIAIQCPDRGIYETGYLYLFENPKIPVSILDTYDLAVAVDNDKLYVILTEYHENASSVKFTATQLILENEFDCWDLNLSDWCSCELELTPGFYKIKAYVYDDADILLEEHIIILKMLVILI